MTRKEIKNTPEIVDYLLAESIIADSREKLHKRMEEICNLAIKALEQELCEDCISRQAVIDEMEKRHAEGDCITKGFIKNMPSVTPQEPWIPVSERLPEPFEFVNCTCHSLIDDREDWVVETCYIPQPHNSPYSDWGNIPMLNSCECEVIAWMYRDIPKPYKAESEG